MRREDEQTRKCGETGDKDSYYEKCKQTYGVKTCGSAHHSQKNLILTLRDHTVRCECVSYLDLTGSDQVVDVIESFLHCFAHGHQAMVFQDEHLEGRKGHMNAEQRATAPKKQEALSTPLFCS